MKTKVCSIPDRRHFCLTGKSTIIMIFTGGMNDMMNKQKSLLLAGILFLLSVLTVQAEDGVLWGSNYMKGNIIPGGMVSLESGPGYQELALGVYPSAEIILLKPRIAGFSFLDLGVAVDGRVGVPLRDSDFTAGASAEATIHLGFRGFDFPGSEYLDPLDIYTTLGVGMDFLHPDGFRAGLAVSSGVNYFLSDRLMVGAGYTGWLDYSGMSLQVRYRFGKTPAVKGMGELREAGEEVLIETEKALYLTHFYSVLFLSVYSGGYNWAPGSYEEGDVTLWEYRGDDSSFFLERCLISRTPDGEEWWRLRYEEEGEEYMWEFLLSPEQELEKLYYADGTGEVRDWSFEGEEDQDIRERTVSAAEVAAYDIQSLFPGGRTEDVAVPAGSYRNCYVVDRQDETSEYTWWFAEGDRVPGSLVRFRMMEQGNVLDAELYDIFWGEAGVFYLNQN